jgi:prophage regulatory protein
MSDKQRMRTAELVEEFGIPAETWRYWRWKGEGPASYKVGRHVLYDRADVEAWVVARKAATLRGSAA